MAAPLFPNPDDYPDWKEWAQDVRRNVQSATLETLPIVASPVLLATHTDRASAVTPGVLMYDAVNKEPTVSDGTQWSNLPPTSVSGGGGGLRWIPDYTVGPPQREGNLVLDEGWLMRANKNTLERAAPLGAGSPAYVSGLGDTPPWVENLHGGSFWVTGQRYTFTAFSWMSTIRYWYPSATRQVILELWLVVDPLDKFEITQVFGPFAPNALPEKEWIEYPLRDLPIPPSTVDVVLLHKPVPIPIITSGTWDQQNTDSAPISGKMSWNTIETDVEFNNTDKSGTDQTEALGNIPVGASMTVEGTTYLVITKTINAGTVEFQVLPDNARPAQGNNRPFQFSYFVNGIIDYVNIVDHFIADPNVRGFSGDTYLGAVAALNDDAYGIDIEIDLAVVSADWDILAYTPELADLP